MTLAYEGGRLPLPRPFPPNAETAGPALAAIQEEEEMPFWGCEISGFPEILSGLVLIQPWPDTQP